MRDLMRGCVGTKFSSRYGDLICDLALDAVHTVSIDDGAGHKEIDIKRFAKVEKIPGGELSDCKVLKGVMIEKDSTHPRMKRRIVRPRIILLDCPLEYKKAESAAALELNKEEDFEAILRQEECVVFRGLWSRTFRPRARAHAPPPLHTLDSRREYIQKMCSEIIRFKPDVVITEKGVSDLASHYFVKAGITSIRRIRKTDNLRIARSCGATIVSRPDELLDTDVGTGCGVFEIKKIGDDYFSFFEECDNPKACTILLRGGSKDVINELERNLQDAMQVARNVVFEPKLLPGGGAVEMAISVGLAERSRTLEGVELWPFKAMGTALEVIPRTLAQNAGADVVRLLTDLRSKKANGANPYLGIDGIKGTLVDMREEGGVLDPYAVRSQTLKSAVESACLLLRIDDVLTGMRNQKYDQQREDKRPAEEQDAEGGGGREE